MTAQNAYKNNIYLTDMSIKMIQSRARCTVDGIRPWTLSLSDDVKSLVNKNDSVMC